MNATGYIHQSEYEPRFWNMARCRSGQDDRLSTGYNTTNGTYTLPAAFGKKLEQTLSKESLFRGLGTVIHAYGNDYTLYAKDTDDLAQFVEEGGLIPVYDGIDDFTVSKIGSHIYDQGGRISLRHGAAAHFKEADHPHRRHAPVPPDDPRGLAFYQGCHAAAGCVADALWLSESPSHDGELHLCSAFDGGKQGGGRAVHRLRDARH